jgi:ComF family protein
MTLINDFLSLIYPRHCEACGNNLFKHEYFVCNYCQLNLPKSNYHKQPQNELSYVFAGRIPFQNALSFYVFEKSGKIQRLLHAIKYQNQKTLAEFLGKQYAKDLISDNVFADVDVIIPIPLHKNKLKTRGFNQSEYFAKGISEKMNIAIDTTTLIRKTETSTQTKKRKYQRWENVEGIFELTNANALKNKHVLIIDDVITTGATIEAAWQCVKEVEGIKISVAAIAFASKKS